MAHLFQLTPAESRLLEQLADGRELRGAADTLTISVYTERNQLKAVLRKSGRRNQAELLALFNRFGAVVKAREGCSRS
jgi:DNA-binding CsgD family transcriptional regulator